MPIPVVCSCGARLQAQDEHAGRRAKCRTCGAILEIPIPTLEPEPVVSVTSITATIGTIQTPECYMRMAIFVSESGQGLVSVVAADPSSRSKEAILTLGRKQFEELKELVRKTDSTIAALQSRGQLQRMIEG